MSSLNIYKETALPDQLTANSIYLISDINNTEYFTIYATNNNTIDPIAKRILNSSDILNLIDSQPQNIKITESIASRNLMQLNKNTFAFITDLQELHLYDNENSNWIEIIKAQEALRIFNSSGTRIY